MRVCVAFLLSVCVAFPLELTELVEMLYLRCNTLSLALTTPTLVVAARTSPSPCDTLHGGPT